MIRQTSREKKNSVSSDETSSQPNIRGKRISLIQRQNMIAQKAKEAKSSDSSNTNSQTNIRTNNNLTIPQSRPLPKRKYKVNLANRKPLYPASKKSREDSAPVVRNNFRRAIAGPRIRRAKAAAAKTEEDNKTSRKSTSKASRRGSTRSFTVLGSAHSKRSSTSGKSQKTIATKDRSTSRSPSRSRTPTPGTATPSRSPSPASIQSDHRSASRRGSYQASRSESRNSHISEQPSMKSRHSSRRSSRQPSMGSNRNKDDSPDNSRSPSLRSRHSERNPSIHSSHHSAESGLERSRSPSPDKSRTPSPERIHTAASAERSHSPSPAPSRSRTPSPIESRAPSENSRGSNSPRESFGSGVSRNTRRSSRRNSHLTIASKRSRISNNGSNRQESGQSQKSRNSQYSRRTESRGTERSSRKSSIRSRRSSNGSNRSNSRKRTEDVLDDSDIEGEEREASRHGSLRYGSNFSSRSIRMNTRGSGQGQLNDAFPSPFESRTTSSRFTDYDSPFKSSRRDSDHTSSYTR